MVIDTPRARVLIALFDLARRGDAHDLSRLSEEAGLTSYRTLKELSLLQERGWVDARRLRLTLAGLAVAVALDAPPATQLRSRRPTAAGPRAQRRPRPAVARKCAA